MSLAESLPTVPDPPAGPLSAPFAALPAPTRPPDLLRSVVGPSVTALDAGSVSLLVDADTSVLVVLHGAVDGGLQDDVRDLVEDLVTNAVQTSGRPVRVLAEQVTRFELTGVWLLLELRRAARPERVTLVRPSEAVRDAIALHGISGLDVED
ncbi:hypothetical protein GCM10027446_24420 [Angustibacter peucedani]